uniref:Putative methyltransferase n=1 Tax=Tetraselmis sp. GSL018 TaxID=582737 RepID=A0A061RLC0_9CHLO|mmetsp:Transcript_18045/g.43224  ORF Transcript_18045/g.43224 Transcript_18045/m.43224 type:complete len:528 (+) Transcript_18045:186-1769(+)|eukprot:CAMPEP_0177581476 /NCGR_PEP_ID=MMETSP0419_2-20121207/2169_1 /TAXON_ID=582737 /ORGANISM="Tetraselmis sp., Strain GSL018" /LENGTH=527 /DNA_ID=CAMNT_0019070523 /DNA_START=228 /DNA_END=1811 /DNA_ORIENTATION=+
MSSSQQRTRKRSGVPNSVVEVDRSKRAKKPKHKSVLKRGRYWSLASPVQKQAAEALKQLFKAHAKRKEGVSIKSLTLAPNVVAKKATFAVTQETLRYLPVIKSIVEDSELLKENERLEPEAAYVLTYDLLLGQGCKPHGGAERAVLARKAALQSALARRMAQAKVTEPQQLLAKPLTASPRPRAARVNTLHSTVPEALQALREPQGGSGRAAFKDVRVHDLLPDVLLFPEGTDLHDHPLVLGGTLVLQSVSSCMPAHALSPEPGWRCVDCCAAPGNKTTHVAALLRGTGSVLAFDRDAARLERLRENVRTAGAANVVARAGDFLATDPESGEFAEVQGVILDPSCSGSGLALTRGDNLVSAALGEGGGADRAAQEADKGRVEMLARFQEAALRHALRFPRLRRLVYSTCSVHSRENEEVVSAVLKEAAARGLRLADPFPGWPRRGLPVFDGAEKLVRVDPYEDGTDGFFVALFERAEPSGRADRPAVPEEGSADEKKREKRKRKRERQRARKRLQAAAEPSPENGSS